MILIVPAEDFWKTVPELGLMSRDNEEEGMVRVTEDAEAEELLKVLISRDPRIIKDNDAIVISPETGDIGEKNVSNERDF